MSQTSESNAKCGFEDPRCRSNFRPHYFPQVNGGDAPPVGATEQNDRIKIEFLAAYYDLNCEYSRLLAVRKGAESPMRAGGERECLQAIEKVLIVRDRLEDQYAPLGVISEPVTNEGFTVNLKISFGNADAAGRRRTDLYTLTTIVPIPMPEGMKIDELPMKIEGPGFNGEY